MRFKKINKFLILLGTSAAISTVSLSDLKAQGDSQQLLQEIVNNTAGILQNLENLPTYLNNIGQLVLAWISPDNSKPTAAMQANFTQLGNLLNQDIISQTGLQTNLNNDLLNNNGKNIYNANAGTANTPGIATPSNLWYANDLVYSTLLGNPWYPKDPRQKGSQAINSQYNYIKNASGLNIYHQIPGTNWQGSTGAQSRYQSYFNTVMSVESFNAYILSNHYADGNQFTTLQTTLIAQATDPTDWFQQVATENIGFVLRQVLLYQSQIFVLLTQMIQLQKQAVAAQAMTNSLMIAINQMSENIMVSSAQGTQPTQ